MSPSSLADRPSVVASPEAPRRVLLVVANPQRLALLQRCVQNNLPGCVIETVDSYFDAMARATRMQAHLLVLDLSLDSVLVPALKRFLARAAPQALVHVFDDSPPRQNSCRPDRTKNLGAAMKDDSGSIRTSIQRQSGGQVAAAGERLAGGGFA